MVYSVLVVVCLRYPLLRPNSNRTYNICVHNITYQEVLLAQ